MEIKDKLRKAREQKGVSQRQAAAEMGISHNYYNEFLKRREKMITEERARELVEEIVNEFLKWRGIEDREIIYAWTKGAWATFVEWDCTEDEIREIYSYWLTYAGDYF